MKLSQVDVQCKSNGSRRGTARSRGCVGQTSRVLAVAPVIRAGYMNQGMAQIRIATGATAKETFQPE